MGTFDNILQRGFNAASAFGNPDAYRNEKLVRDQMAQNQQQIDLNNLLEMIKVYGINSPQGQQAAMQIKQSPQFQKFSGGMQQAPQIFGQYNQMTQGMPQQSQGGAFGGMAMPEQIPGYETTLKPNEYGRMESTYKQMTPDLQAINTGEKTSIFNKQTGEIQPTEYPSSKVSSITQNVNPAPATAIKEILDYQDIADSIKQLDSVLEQTKELQGPGRKTLTGLQEKYSTVLGQPPEGVTEFEMIRNNMSDILARMRTGAAINAQEEKLYFEKYAPRLDLPYKSNKRRLETFDKIIQTKIKGLRSTYEGLGYKVPKGQTDLSKYDQETQTKIQKALSNGYSMDEILEALGGE